jgi:hypothetical protein
VSTPTGPAPGDADRIARALGWRPDRFRPAAGGRGASVTAARWIVGAGEGPRTRSAFVKIGSTALTAAWTRVEYANYRSLRGWFLPKALGFDDDGERPTLALEDLSAADWPPPWSDDRVASVLEALGAVAGTTPPEHAVDTMSDLDRSADWRAVADDPAPLLALGLCSRRWLGHALPALVEAAGTAPLAGDALVHFDIRSDNLCFRDGRAIVIDWNHAQRANAELDIAAWLPSLHAEGGPAPENILPDAPGLAAWVAGFFCARAGGPPIRDAPHVRPLQLMQSRSALPWAARALGLTPP